MKRDARGHSLTMSLWWYTQPYMIYARFYAPPWKILWVFNLICTSLSCIYIRFMWQGNLIFLTSYCICDVEMSHFVLQKRWKINHLLAQGKKGRKLVSHHGGCCRPLLLVNELIISKSFNALGKRNNFRPSWFFCTPMFISSSNRSAGEGCGEVTSRWKIFWGEEL